MTPKRANFRNLTTILDRLENYEIRLQRIKHSGGYSRWHTVVQSAELDPNTFIGECTKVRRRILKAFKESA